MTHDVASLLILCGFIGLMAYGAGHRRSLKLEARDGTRLNWTQFLVEKRIAKNGKAGAATTDTRREGIKA